MPALDAESLRAAVEMVVPTRRPEFDRHMARAMHQARDQESLDPLRLFSLHWGVIVVVERWPDRAARLREYDSDRAHVVAGLPVPVIAAVEHAAGQLAALGRDAREGGHGQSAACR
jgi:hypothetical protein